MSELFLWGALSYLAGTLTFCLWELIAIRKALDRLAVLERAWWEFHRP